MCAFFTKGTMRSFEYLSLFFEFFFGLLQQLKYTRLSLGEFMTENKKKLQEKQKKVTIQKGRSECQRVDFMQII